MHRLFSRSCVLFAVLAIWTHFAFGQSNYGFELADIDQGRLSNPEQSRNRLSAIPINALSAEEREYYQYLNAYFPKVPSTQIVGLPGTQAQDGTSRAQGQQ